MRIILPFLFLLLHAHFVSAQNNEQDTTKISNAENKRRVAPMDNHDLRMQNYDLKIEVKEFELEKLISTYKEGSRARKKALKGDIQKTIYEIFDLKLYKKQEEANMLNKRLTLLKNDVAYQSKSEEIITLQKMLEEVQNQLTFRREKP